MMEGAEKSMGTEPIDALTHAVIGAAISTQSNSKTA